MAELPDEVLTEARRLTRLARQTGIDDEATEYRRERARLLSEYGYRARVRDEANETVLVLYPSEWMDNGTVDPPSIDDLDRAIELSLNETIDEDRWEEIEAHNTEIALAVEESAGVVHGANATAFATFMGNHYLKRVEEATNTEIREFLTEYFPRNSWPTDEQRAEVERSLRLLFEEAGRSSPNELQVE
jgi:hypothetical protein